MISWIPNVFQPIFVMYTLNINLSQFDTVVNHINSLFNGMDSCANRHSTNNKQHLTNIKNLKTPIKVNTSGGVIEVTEYGLLTQ